MARRRVIWARTWSNIDCTKDIDTWYRLLERLVRVQGDGRAVTRQLPEDELRKIANDLQCRLRDEGALGYFLTDVGILRCDGKDGSRRWTLGHDSRSAWGLRSGR